MQSLTTKRLQSICVRLPNNVRADEKAGLGAELVQNLSCPEIVLHPVIEAERDVWLVDPPATQALHGLRIGDKHMVLGKFIQELPKAHFFVAKNGMEAQYMNAIPFQGVSLLATDKLQRSER